MVHTEKYRGWTIIINRNFSFISHQYEWVISKGALCFKDPTSAQNIDTSIVWAKERIDYFENNE